MSKVISLDKNAINEGYHTLLTSMSPEGKKAREKMMNHLNVFKVQEPNVVHMSHIEIAKIAGKRSDSVKRTIERLVDEGAIPTPQIVERPKQGIPGQFVYHLLLDRLSSITVMATVNSLCCANLVRRWDDLESGRARPSNVPLIDTQRLSSAEQRIEEIEHQLEDPTNRIHLTEPPEGYACASVLQEFIPYSFSFVKKTVRYFKLPPVYYITQSAEGERYPVRSYHIEDFMTAAALVEEEAKQISRCYKEHPVVGRFRNR